MRAMVAVVTLSLAGCAAPQSRGPMDIALATPRAQVEADLRERGFCREQELAQRKQTFARCDTPGLELGQAWIAAEFDRDGALVALRRMERYATDDEAMRRWNALVEAHRGRSGEPSDEARRLVAEGGGLPPGASAWMSWYVADGHGVASIYLVQDPPPGKPNVIEEIAPVPQ